VISGELKLSAIIADEPTMPIDKEFCMHELLRDELSRRPLLKWGLMSSKLWEFLRMTLKIQN
jgi:hypothetical protein